MLLSKYRYYFAGKPNFDSSRREFSEFLTTASAGLQNQLESAVSGTNNALTAAVETINRIPGVDIETPNIKVNLDFLKDVTLPNGFMDALVSLNASLPTLDELKTGMNDLVSTPFLALRSEINDTLGNAAVNRSLLPVPEKQSMVFCAVSSSFRTHGRLLMIVQ